jgi:hypothetical protein
MTIDISKMLAEIWDADTVKVPLPDGLNQIVDEAASGDLIVILHRPEHNQAVQLLARSIHPRLKVALHTSFLIPSGTTCYAINKTKAERAMLKPYIPRWSEL